MEARNKDHRHQTWAFSVYHDFVDEEKDFIHSLKSRVDLARVSYTMAYYRQEYVMKGVVDFVVPVSKEVVRTVMETKDVIWMSMEGENERMKWLERVRQDIGSNVMHDCVFIHPKLAVAVAEPFDDSKLKGLELIDDSDACLNCSG